MELKFIFSIIVLLNLRICVSGASVEDCIGFVYLYPEEAKGFADEDAKQEDLDLAIGSITKAFWNPDDSSLRDYDYFDWAEDESRITADLTQCYEARKNPEFLDQYHQFQAERIFKYPIQVLGSSWFIGVQWIPVVFGLIGNIALIAIFRKKDSTLRFNSLILTLAVFDLIYLCTQITQSMAMYFEEKAFYHKMTVFSNTAFSLSTFTAIAISIERYCMLCRNINTEKVQLWVVIFTIMMIATLSNVQWMVESTTLETEFTQYIVSAVLYIIPAIVITALNVAIFRQLKRLLQTDQFSSASNEIKKVLFQIGLTNLIAIIFVGSQVAYVIYVGLEIFLYSPENLEKFNENPSEWETLYTFSAYIYPVMIICRLLNCSLNFYAYVLLRYRNQRAKTCRRQKRQQDQETTKKTDESNCLQTP